MNITTLSSVARALAVLCLALAASRASAQACGNTERLPFDRAYGVSADGTIVVGYRLIGRAILWSEEAGTFDIGNLGNTPAKPQAVSADGRTVVGYSATSSYLLPAFRWSDSDGMQNLDTLLGNSEATAVSSDGSVVVGTAYNQWGFGGDPRVFRWTETTGMQDLGRWGRGQAWAYAVSADGTVLAGYVREAQFPFIETAFRWSANDGFRGVANGHAFGMSADGNVIVGEALYDGTKWLAFRWTTTTGLQWLGTLSGHGAVSSARGVSADGRVVVGLSADSGVVRPFRWTEVGGMMEIRTVGSFASALAVSGDGRTVVGSDTVIDGNGNGYEQAFRWVSNLADVNGDGFLNADDFDQFAAAFESGDPAGDFNHDSFVNGDDYDAFAEAFEAGC
ncbi:MAG: hypothetical protein JNL50_01905 [Phycisphaerae bacterium]|nr:hypothetical protein [Phycisphaerae bacterium]